MIIIVRPQSERYRHRAIEVRLIADMARDRNIKRILEGVAEDWDRMAASIDRIDANDRRRASRVPPD